MEKEVLLLLEEVLHLNGRSSTFSSSTQLLGSLPELDSLAVASLLTKIEEKFEIRIEDDEVTGAVFHTVGSLVRFISGHLKTSAGG